MVIPPFLDRKPIAQTNLRDLDDKQGSRQLQDAPFLESVKQALTQPGPIVGTQGIKTSY